MQQILIMHSADGMQWARVALFPEDWSSAQADNAYLEALEEAQAGEDWSWDEIEAAMVKRGFTIPNWHVADYAWDEQAVYAQETEGIEPVRPTEEEAPR